MGSNPTLSATLQTTTERRTRAPGTRSGSRPPAALALTFVHRCPECNCAAVPRPSRIVVVVVVVVVVAYRHDADDGFRSRQRTASGFPRLVGRMSAAKSARAVGGFAALIHPTCTAFLLLLHPALETGHHERRLQALAPGTWVERMPGAGARTRSGAGWLELRAGLRLPHRDGVPR